MHLLSSSEQSCTCKCVRMCVYACMHMCVSNKPSQPPQIGYHICISKLTYHSIISNNNNDVWWTIRIYNFNIPDIHWNLWSLGFQSSFFPLVLIFLLNAFPHAILALFFPPLLLRFWTFDPYTIKSSNVQQ